MASTDQVSTAEQPTGTSAETVSQRESFINSDSNRQANWLLGVEPQDLRFPVSNFFCQLVYCSLRSHQSSDYDYDCDCERRWLVPSHQVNIIHVAFTASYSAALTADRRKIYINPRRPGASSNCKRRSIDFPADRRPLSLVSFDHQDVLCVVLRSRIEFHCLASGARVGNYQTPTAEVVAAASRFGRSPLGALWCSGCSSASFSPSRSSAMEAAFTVWTERTDAPKNALLLGQSLTGRLERFLRFYWTSEDSVLLVSRLSDPSQPQRQQKPQPLIFSAFDTAGCRPMQRLCRRSVHSACQFRLSPNGRLLLLSGGSRHQLIDAISLRLLLTLPRCQSSPLPMAVTNAGDLLLLRPQPSASLEIHRSGGWLGPPAQLELTPLLGGSGDGEFRLYAIGSFGALVVCERVGASVDEAAGGGDDLDTRKAFNSDRSQNQQGDCLVILLDLNGTVLMRASWPRARIQMVTDDLVVYLRSMSVDPFSAAHAVIFDFNVPAVRHSCWAVGDVGYTIGEHRADRQPEASKKSASFSQNLPPNG